MSLYLYLVLYSCWKLIKANKSVFFNNSVGGLFDFAIENHWNQFQMEPKSQNKYTSNLKMEVVEWPGVKCGILRKVYPVFQKVFGIFHLYQHITGFGY